jgi:hypothetical protein
VNLMSKSEEITDMMTPKAFEDFRVGKVLGFADGTRLRITKIDRKNKRMWAVKVELVNQTITRTHYGHNVTGGGPGDLPFCNDCKVHINEPSTEDGDKKALDRADRTLSDGTIVD